MKSFVCVHSSPLDSLPFKVNQWMGCRIIGAWHVLQVNDAKANNSYWEMERLKFADFFIASLIVAFSLYQ